MGFFSLFLIGMIHCYQIVRHSSDFQMFPQKHFYVLDRRNPALSSPVPALWLPMQIFFEICIALVLPVSIPQNAAKHCILSIIAMRLQ